MELAAGLIGVVVGAGLTVGVAWLERHWHRQDVRAAEKRARLEERFESVRRYAAGLAEFVSEAGSLMQVWNQRTPEGWEGWPEVVQGQLQRRLDDVNALKPRPKPLYVVRNKEAQARLLALELGAHVCMVKCIEHLRAGMAMSEEVASGFAAEANEALDKLLKQMDEVVEKVR